MIAVDTNILIYSHRKASPWFAAASSAMHRLAESGYPWAIPWPCIHKFLGVTTHPKVLSPPALSMKRFAR